MTKKLNITYRSEDPVAKILSNLAPTPFSYGGYKFKCIEGALQGIKFKNKKQREKVFTMTGLEALKAGRAITLSIQDGEERFVYWNGKRIPYNSPDHRLLIVAFIMEKFRQSEKAREALLSTTDAFIYHDAGPEHPKTSLPEKLFIEPLLSIRQILLKLLSLV